MATKQCLTRGEAVKFVKEKLGLNTIEDATLDYHTLREIQRRLMSEVPFQNVSLMMMPPEKRFPTAEDVLTSGLSLLGGTCERNNWFACLLLKALGFNIHNIAAIYCSERELADMHMMCVVRGVADPDDPQIADPLFLVDVASGFPLPRPVPLHRLPVTFPETAGLRVRFAWHEDMIHRLHYCKDPRPDEKHPSLDGWQVIMKFNTSPRDPASLKDGMNVTFLADPPLDFLKSFRLFRWPHGKDWAVAFRDNELMFFGENFPAPTSNKDENERKCKILIEDSELEAKIREYFPTLCPKQLKGAFNRTMELKGK
ncbi:uncharacterized protein LOC124165487 [Ischnura elegans]|uniref:uncharacterized protein LOC124165487 n=1 Tax=Ischnura elegans TaxID=197161 RepID=UPI001ED877AE|nr:uncharacterized protein LOC124165487 [Ischnura elegans]